MNKRIKLLTVLLPGIMIVGFSVAGLLMPDKNYSESERRVLAKRPELTLSSLVDGSYMNDVDAYSMDQFPERDLFRTIKAGFTNYVLLQKDNNQLYFAGNHISKLEYPLNEARVRNSLLKQKAVYEKYLKETDCRIYQSIIPDKNCYLAPPYGYPHIDYEKYMDLIKEETAYAEFIDISGLLDIDDFYMTDQHWKQENITDVAECIGSAMGVDVSDINYDQKTLANAFYGAYYNQAALPHEADEITYLTNTMLENCIVTSYNSGTARPAKMYDLEKGAGRDPYEMFLSGSDALLVIENPDYESDYAVSAPGMKEEKELVVFRDSFGSSLIPLLVPGYSRITVVDLRYINSDLLGQFIDFDKQDVLFMYCSLIY